MKIRKIEQSKYMKININVCIQLFSVRQNIENVIRLLTFHDNGFCQSHIIVIDKHLCSYNLTTKTLICIEYNENTIKKYAMKINVLIFYLENVFFIYYHLNLRILRLAPGARASHCRSLDPVLGTLHFERQPTMK